MCLPIAAAAGTAAAFTNTMAVVSAGISAISVGAGIVGQQQQLKAQAAQAQYQANERNRQLASQHEQAQRKSFNTRQQQIAQYTGQVKAQQAANLSYNKQIGFNNEAANRVYVAEQTKEQEARDKAAFKSQQIYAKQIGSLGSVLAAGGTGQSYGLLAQDTARQAGFAQAEQNASLRSARAASAVAMEGGRLQSQSANNQALSSLPAPVSHPLLEMAPAGIGRDLGLGIPSYNWA